MCQLVHRNWTFPPTIQRAIEVLYFRSVNYSKASHRSIKGEQVQQRSSMSIYSPKRKRALNTTCVSQDQIKAGFPPTYSPTLPFAQRLGIRPAARNCEPVILFIMISFLLQHPTTRKQARAPKLQMPYLGLAKSRATLPRDAEALPSYLTRIEQGEIQY